MITERQKLILIAAVDEYIKTAQPVGSNLIQHSHDLQISSATVRSELVHLEEEGYLYQPHTSSGRIPTDAGYRFFVNTIIEEKDKEFKKTVNIIGKLARLKEEEDVLFADLAKTVSALSKNMVLSGSWDARMLFKAGINEVLSQPELEDFTLRNHFGNIVDSFEENLDELSELTEYGSPTIFIGKENPISDAQDFSMIVSKCRLLSDEGVIVILGPKRMNYKRNLQLLDSLINLFE